MKTVINWLGTLVADAPLPLLEVWGRFSYVLGFGLALYAFGGFTFRIGERWRFGRERQAWDAKAFISIPLTFVAVLVSGYLGSFIVLVPGAQTFESLKDLVVFLCVVLLGYPALITVPFAYGLSDLIEGTPPEFLLAWLPGYFINPACFWLAYQLIGKNPDFRRARTWLAYLLFVVMFMSLEPVLWGYICSEQFTPAISYQSVTAALFFTTGITWLLAPIAMLGALPLARRTGLFWAEIAGHVRERAFGRVRSEWVAGGEEPARVAQAAEPGLPIRMFILGPFVALVLLMVAVTAYVTLRSASDDANKLAGRLHQETAQNINLQLDAYLTRAPDADAVARASAIKRLLEGLPIALHGRAFILDRSGYVVSSSAPAGDTVTRVAADSFATVRQDLRSGSALQFGFDHVSAKPLARETWLAQANPYHGDDQLGWTLITAMPESYYLAGVRAGHSRSAMIFAVALLLSLAVAGTLASIVASPLRRMVLGTRALERGDLAQRVPSSRLEELRGLSESFNRMAERLKESFDSVRTSENRLQLAITAADLGIWDWDVQNDRLVWDESMYRLYGIEKQRFSGALDAWKSRVLPDDLVRATGDVEAALRGERDFASEFRVTAPDGSIRSIRGVGQTIRGEDGRPLRMVGVNWDVTAELHAEQELRRHRDHLEELVHERTLALARSEAQADAANRAKSAFLANMSHEIRTPMNAILGFGQLLEREAELSQRAREHVGRILASGEHLLALINNVLELSKIEAGRMLLSESTFDLHQAIASVDAMARRQIEAKGLRFTIEGIESLPRFVHTDAAKLRQVLLNLLVNAGKFTESGTIALRGAADRAGTRVGLRFEVQDTGIGIAAHELERVFEPFEQSASGVSAQTGTGLGLPISRSIARLMAGDLRARSTPGVGSTFELEVHVNLGSPSAVDSELRAAQVVGLDADQKVPLILVVDDEEDNRRALSELLVSVGIEVAEAANGALAVERFAELQPDLVFMDWRMPVMDGAEATRRLRATERGANVPVVLLSASVLDGERATAQKTDADAFIAKPFHAAQIWHALEQHLGVRFVRRDASAQTDAHAAPLTRASVAALGAETVGALREALETGYLDRVLKLLAQHDEAHAEVVAALCRLAANFEIETLIALLTSQPAEQGERAAST